MKPHERLQTTREAILAADPKMLAQAYMRHNDECFDDPDRQIDMERAMEVMSRIVEDVRGTEAGRDEAYVIVPTHILDEGSLDEPTQLTCTTSAELMLTSEVANVTVQDDFVPIRWAYEFNAWEETLAYLVFRPSDMTEREWHTVLADVLWEMTFFGLTRAQAHENAERETDVLKSAMAELDDPDVELKSFTDLVDEAWPEYRQYRESDECRFRDHMRELVMRMQDGLNAFDREVLLSLAKLLVEELGVTPGAYQEP